MIPWTPCGDGCHESTHEWPAADQCGHCSPRPCSTCGDLDHPNALCACWVDLTAMAAADVKALFAADGWTVATDGRLSR